jgi:hypothetical protein
MPPNRRAIRVVGVGLTATFSVFSSFIKQHSEASGRIAGLAARVGDRDEALEEGEDEFAHVLQ